MVSPRERSRAARRRIAGERARRTEPQPGRPAEAHPADRAHEPVGAEPVGAEPVGAEPVEAVPPSGPVPTPTADPVPGHGGAPVEETPVASGDSVARTTGEPPNRLVTVLASPPNWFLGLLAGLVVAALAVDGLLLWKQQRDEEAAARALHSAVTVAPSVAERAAQEVLSFRYDTIERDAAEARRYLTADYAPAYISSIRDVVAGAATDTKATVQARVLTSGVAEASGERSNVLLFVNQTTTLPGEPPKTALNRVVFTMVPRDGAWKVDEIQAF